MPGGYPIGTPIGDPIGTPGGYPYGGACPDEAAAAGRGLMELDQDRIERAEKRTLTV